MITINERDLSFQFPDDVVAERLDRNHPPDNISPPKGMSVVDLIVEEEGRTLLVEVSDPPATSIAAKDVKKALKALAGVKYAWDEAVPKARDSYTYLHLMERDTDRVFVLVIVIGGLDQLAHDPALLSNLARTIKERLLQEDSHRWRRTYVHDCIVTTETLWNKHFPGYPLVRRSEVEGG